MWSKVQVVVVFNLKEESVYGAMSSYGLTRLSLPVSQPLGDFRNLPLYDIFL